MNTRLPFCRWAKKSRRPGKCQPWLWRYQQWLCVFLRRGKFARDYCRGSRFQSQAEIFFVFDENQIARRSRLNAGNIRDLYCSISNQSRVNKFGDLPH
jgi:hypothetical protein